MWRVGYVLRPSRCGVYPEVFKVYADKLGYVPNGNGGGGSPCRAGRCLANPRTVVVGGVTGIC